MLGNHMHGTTTSRILGCAHLRRKRRDPTLLPPSLMLLLGPDTPPGARGSAKICGSSRPVERRTFHYRPRSTSGEPPGFRLADVEEEPGRAPPAHAREPPAPRVGEAHVEIVDVFGGGEEPHGPTQYEHPRTQRRDPDEGKEAYPKKDGVEDPQHAVHGGDPAGHSATADPRACEQPVDSGLHENGEQWQEPRLQREVFSPAVKQRLDRQYGDTDEGRR